MDIRLRLLQCGSHIVVVLLADCLIDQQFPQASGLQSDRGQVGLGPAEGGLCIVEGRLIGGGIDLIEDLADFDIGAFLKQAFLNDAAHLWTQFSDHIGRRPPGQFRRDHQPLRLYRHDGDFGRSARWRSAFVGLLSATTQDQDRGEDTPGGDSFGPVIDLHATPLLCEI